MNIGAILVGIALLVLVAVYVARPLFERRPGQWGERPLRVIPQAQLSARRDAVYALIRELDADYQTGKVNDQDYQTQRQRYVAEGVSLLQQLDALANDNNRAALEAEIEAEVLALRQKPGFLEKPDFPEAAARFCTQCGHRAAPGHNFCGQCGAPLKRMVQG